MSVCKFKLFSVFIALALVACATSKQSSVTDAVIIPLQDLNLMQVEIPAVLVEAQKAPYAMPLNQNCLSLDLTIRTLDEVLGPDLDAAKPETDTDLIELGARTAEETAIGSMRSTVEGIVPFRGWIRKLSGAERHTKQVADAISAGIVRRAFAKGLRASKDCP